MPKRWEIVERELEEFQKYLTPKVPQVRIRKGFDRQENDRHKWASENRDLLNQRGVYLFFDKEEKLIYVGKASTSNWFDKRVWTHEDQAKFQSRPARWIDFIPFEEGLEFLAPALEEFLIGRLNPVPVHNKVGR